MEHLMLYKFRLKERGFTPRQAEIISRLVLGSSNKEIAKHLRVTEKAIKWHLTNIYRVAKSNGRDDLIKAIEKWKIYG
jgi:DNA-binding CsgD family transcriptional regulator